MKLRYRWYGPCENAPMIGEFVMSQRGRVAYRILDVRTNRQSDVVTIFTLTVEHVTRAAAAAGPERCMEIIWDRRKRRVG